MAASVAIGLAVAAPAEALELKSRYSVGTAQSSQYNNSGGHTLWKIDNIVYVAESADDGSSNLFWDVYEEEDGSSFIHFHGDVFQKGGTNDQNGWTVDVRFTELPGPGTGGPKLELNKNTAYVVPGDIDLSEIDLNNIDLNNLPADLPDDIQQKVAEAQQSLMTLQKTPEQVKVELAAYIASRPSSHNTGGPVDPTTWSFFDFASDYDNELRGFGINNDRTLTIADVTGGKYPVQVGFGANGKNTDFGMSTWFSMTENDQLIRRDDGKAKHADFNVNLTQVDVPPTDVPTPAAGLAWLMTSGAAIARKRKQSRED